MAASSCSLVPGKHGPPKPNRPLALSLFRTVVRTQDSQCKTDWFSIIYIRWVSVIVYGLNHVASVYKIHVTKLVFIRSNPAFVI